MTRRGFTIVELIITITIMGILLTLAVVNVNSTQIQARDTERKVDIESIANALEGYYLTGANGSVNLGRYPSIALTDSVGTLTTNLSEVNLKSFMAPGIDDPMTTFIPSTNTGNAKSIQTTAGVLPQPTKDQYVYQVIKTDGSICGSGVVECRKFNLF